MTVQQFIDELLKVARPEDFIEIFGEFSNRVPEIILSQNYQTNGTGITVVLK